VSEGLITADEDNIWICISRRREYKTLELKSTKDPVKLVSQLHQLGFRQVSGKYRMASICTHTKKERKRLGGDHGADYNRRVHPTLVIILPWEILRELRRLG